MPYSRPLTGDDPTVMRAANHVARKHHKSVRWALARHPQDFFDKWCNATPELDNYGSQLWGVATSLTFDWPYKLDDPWEGMKPVMAVPGMINPHDIDPGGAFMAWARWKGLEFHAAENAWNLVQAIVHETNWKFLPKDPSTTELASAIEQAGMVGVLLDRGR